jgi:hypothetical protein
MKADMMEAMARERRHFCVKGKGDRKKKNMERGERRKEKRTQE